MSEKNVNTVEEDISLILEGVDAPLAPEEADNSPASEVADNSLVSEEADNSPVSEEADNPPVSEEADNPPVSEEADNPPVSEEADNSPVSEEADNSPASEEADNSPASEEADNSPVSEEEDNPLVSVIIAETDAEALGRNIKSISSQTYKNIEIIIVNNDEALSHKQKNVIDEEKKQFRHILRKYSKKRQIKVVPFERLSGYSSLTVSDNELFICGAAQAEGEYFIFTNDIIRYSVRYVEDMVKAVKDNGADFAFSDFAINWNNKSSYRYIHSVDMTENDSLLSVFIRNAGNLIGLTCTSDKLISRELWQNIVPDISEFYADESNHSVMYADDLVFSTALWANAKKAAYATDVFSIMNWADSDNQVLHRMSERNAGSITNNIKSVAAYVENICLNSNIQKIDFDKFILKFLSRFIWRTNWIFSNIRESIENAFEISTVDFSFESAFEGRTLSINMPEIEAQIDEASETDTDSNIKIFISMHKPSFTPENNKYLLPIQVGTSLADERFPGMLHDDEGENISDKNKMYCELTAQYWAWKNCPDADYYGFWHYRRYFSFNENETKLTYKPVLNYDALKESYIDERHIAEVCEDYDIIIPDEWKYDEDGRRLNIYDHWSKHFNKSDLDITVKVILNKYPQYYDAVMDILHSDKAIFCNMFIMKKELFEEYSAFCFDILEEVESLIDQKRYNIEEYRTLGHIAERLLAIFVRNIELTRPEIDICHLGRIQYEDTRPVAKVIHPGKENCVSVMLACDDKYMKYTDVLLQSICENASDNYFYDIVICHRGISEYNQQIAKDIFSSKSNMMLRFVDVTRNFEKYKTVHIDRHLTYETYYRFLVLDIFEGYDRVLYLDCDMVVNADIAELFFTDMDDEYIAAVRDYDFIASCVKKEDFYWENILKYINIDDFFNYFQAGVILFNLNNLKDKFTGEKLFEVAMSRNWFFHDQDVLNCLFNGHIKYVDDKWNVFSLLENGSNREELVTKFLAAGFAESYKRSRNNPCIIHYAGIPKVWNDTEVDLGYIFWKYARKSPYYEKLLQGLLAGPGGESVDTDWLTFTVNPENNNVGCKFFTIKTIKEIWSSDYAVIDFMSLSNHKTIDTDTMVIAASMLPHEIDGSWLDIKQFTWEKKVPNIADNVLLRVNEDKDIDIYIRNIEEFSGFAFTVRSLNSRSFLKPTIEVGNHYFVNNPAQLPNDLRKGR